MRAPARLATAEDLAGIGELVVDQCRDPAAHCIHSWAGESGEALAAELAAILAKNELLYVVLETPDGALEGALGCEYDRELGRGWLHGPHRRGDWNDDVALLYQALRDALPAEVSELAAFLSEANVRGRSFYEAHGFAAQPTRHHEYRRAIDDHHEPAATTAITLAERHRPSFFALFDELFPTAYYGHDRLLEMQGDSHEIFVIPAADAADRVDGFAVAYRAAGDHRGEIQFVGVRSDRRRRGLGRQLITAGVDWLAAGGTEVVLNVADDKAGARRLYEEAGFTLRYTGIALKHQTSRSGPAD